jgi:protein-disulfide isomerase
MNITHRLGWVGLATVALALAVGTAAAQKASSGKAPTPAAKVGSEVITLEEVERAVQPQLAKLDEQRHEILDQKLDQLIGERLLAQEAKQRGVSVEQLMKTEVYGKASDVPEADVQSFINQNRARLPKMEEQELRLKVWDYLRSQKVNEQRQSYIQALRSKTPVEVLLEEPSAARVEVSTVGFARGANDAPVTIVEFSDFQCPFCKNASATLKQVLDKYPGKVRWVFRDLPLVSLHPGAPKAHEAARCAADQGKFWEYHDLLFERSPRHSPDDLKQYAQDLKLDGPAFAQCLESGKHVAAVEKDTAEGVRLGLTGTPSFFINGRQLVGAQPITAFQKIIDGELKRLAKR